VRLAESLRIMRKIRHHAPARIGRHDGFHARLQIKQE
jgi:hypothetical protein